MQPKEIIDSMMKEDYFSQWLGIEILEQRAGYCKLGMTLRKEMLNGFGIAHGGITYSVADSALAFASNSRGRKSVSIETSISHIKQLREGDELLAEASCVAETEKLGHYAVRLFLSTDSSADVALFKGVVYKTSKLW